MTIGLKGQPKRYFTLQSEHRKIVIMTFYCESLLIYQRKLMDNRKNLYRDHRGADGSTIMSLIGKNMNTKIAVILFIVICLQSFPVSSNDMNNEIGHLLNYVEETSCKYERNGTMHSGKNAVKHIENKYNYFKNDIDNTEKFIELSATKSTMSGKYYMIHCNGKPIIKSQEWLLHELRSYRLKNSTTYEP